MTAYYLKPTLEDAERLNNILYSALVTSDGINFKPPFDSNTTSYIKWTKGVIVIGDDVLESATDPGISEEDRLLITEVLVFKKTYQEAIAAGWVTAPSSEPVE